MKNKRKRSDENNFLKLDKYYSNKNVFSSSSQELLVSVLKNMDPQLCLSVLKFLLLQDNTDPSVKSMKVIHPYLTFAAGGQGGVVIVTRLERFAFTLICNFTNICFLLA